MQCISTVTYSVLVNGEPTGKISPKVWLRQGDPLSSYIFILCMESLSRQLVHMQRVGNIKGLKVARSAPTLSHLFFADDALFFLKGTLGHVWNARIVMEKFCALLGEMINHQKSYSVFSKNTPRKFVRLLSKKD